MSKKISFIRFPFFLALSLILMPFPAGANSVSSWQIPSYELTAQAGSVYDSEYSADGSFTTVRPSASCVLACGSTEFCGPDRLGIDDNCDGNIDEGCSCIPGQVHWCFRGDPAYLNSPGCFPGTEVCGADGTWGPCVGGVHSTDNCFINDTIGCHPLTTPPFVDVNLKDGTGVFSADAIPGSEVWTVACPDGATPCPGVSGTDPADDFKPLQSGEYIVTYIKGLAGGGTDSCSYPLFVKAPGLRLELQWEHDLGGNGVDLDLHLHQPASVTPWAITEGAAQDCMWQNCTVDAFVPPQNAAAPHWFSDSPAMPPLPVNWYLSPVFEENTCYFSPKGVGSAWQLIGQGCHNPRLDTDNISCDPGVTDPNSPSFCLAENSNIDFPSLNEWTRIGVHYFSNHGLSYDVHPRVKIFCEGELSADLGPAGYYQPQSPVVFSAADGSGSASDNRFWAVADVAFSETCQRKLCTVVPIWSDQTTRTPFLTTGADAEVNFGPPYPTNVTSITITTPNGGETLQAGDLIPVSWVAPPRATKFKLKYSMDNGATWKAAAPGFLSGTSFVWKIPVPATNKKKCLVKVIGFNNNDVKVGTDTSDAPFTIEVVRLTSPNGGEPLTSGNQYSITWITNGIAPTAPIVLSYTLNNGLKWKKIDTSADPSNDGSFLWTVPNVTVTKTKCKVKVVVKDAVGNKLGSDTSDSLSTINPSPAP